MPTLSRSCRKRRLQCVRFIGLLVLAIMIGESDVATSQCVDGTCFVGAEVVTACPPQSTSPRLGINVNTPHPAVVRISNELPRTIDYATGTLVHSSATHGYVLSVSHLLRDGEGRLRVQFADDRIFEAKSVGVDPHWDLSLLKFGHDGLKIPCVEMSASPAYRDDLLTFAGYGPRGVYQERRGALIGYYSLDGNNVREVFRLQGAASEGDSGGPVFDTSGRLAGLVWGADDRAAYATYSGRIRRFLEEALRKESDFTASVRSGIGNVAHDDSGAMEREIPMPGEAEEEHQLEPTLPSTEPASGQGGPDAAPLIDIRPGAFMPYLEDVDPVITSPLDPDLLSQTPPLRASPSERVAIHESSEQESRWAVSLASWGAPALLAALGWTGPPSVAAIFALRLFLARRDRQRNDDSHVRQSAEEEDKRQAAPVHDEYARELADVYALSGRNAAADALLGREFEHELLRAEQSSDAGVAKWARKLRDRVSQRYQRICVERPLPAEPPEDDERL